MTMRIIVDGYNFIGRDRGLRGDLAPKRRRLIERLIQYAKSNNNPITVVFDRQPDDAMQKEEVALGQQGAVEVVYSGRGKIADDLIVERAKQFGKEVTVVSSDRGLRASCLAANANLLYCGPFESMLDASHRNPLLTDGGEA